MEKMPILGESQEDTKISEGAAHEEANMVRAQLRMENKVEKLTAEDYKQALEAVQELKRLAKEEPAANLTGPVIEDTPVVARDCVKAVAISELLLLASADFIVVPLTKALTGRV